MAVSTDPCLLLATTRPIVRSFFEGLGLHVSAVAVGADAVGAEEIARADVAAVDVALEAVGALDLCLELRRRRPELPIVAVVCCPGAVAPSTLRTLLSAGASGIVDLRARSEEARQSLLAAARGELVPQEQLGRGGAAPLQDVFAARPERRELQLRLLELVAHGLPDHEIGRRLHLSPHTVKHHIEQLRRDLRVKNRIELAAWAGRNGFYVAA